MYTYLFILHYVCIHVLNILLLSLLLLLLVVVVVVVVVPCQKNPMRSEPRHYRCSK